MVAQRNRLQPARTRRAKPRRKRFTLQRMTGSELDCGVRLAHAVEKRLTERRRTATRYLEWCKLQRIAAWSPRSVVCFAGVLTRQLHPGTVVKHLSHLRALEVERRSPPLQSLIRNLISVTHLEYAKVGVTHAPDFLTIALAIQTADDIPDPKMRLAALLMVLFGLRRRDIEQFDPNRMSLQMEPREARFELTLTKNRRSVWQRVTVSLPPGLLRHVPRRAFAFVVQEFSRRRVHNIPHDELTAAVRTCCADQEIRAFVTPGSLRRAYVRNIIRLHTSATSGLIDWHAVIAYTGHQKVETVKAFYE